MLGICSLVDNPEWLQHKRYNIRQNTLKVSGKAYHKLYNQAKKKMKAIYLKVQKQIIKKPSKPLPVRRVQLMMLTPSLNQECRYHRCPSSMDLWGCFADIVFLAKFHWWTWHMKASKCIYIPLVKSPIHIRLREMRILLDSHRGGDRQRLSLELLNSRLLDNYTYTFPQNIIFYNSIAMKFSLNMH